MNQFQLISDTQQVLTSNYILRVSDVLNTTGLYNYLRENDAFHKFRREFATLMANAVEGKMNEDFHNTLNFFEKLGFVSNSKYVEHQRRVGLRKGIVSFATSSLIIAAPALIDYIYQNRRAKDLTEFVLGWQAYINKGNAFLIQKRAIQFHSAVNLKFDEQRFREIFERYANRNVFPTLKGRDESEEVRYQLFHTILSACDLNEPMSREVCLDCADVAGLSRNDAEEMISNYGQNQRLVSEVTGFAGIALGSIFQDLASSFDHAKQCSFYTIENDPYTLERVKWRSMIEGFTKDAITQLPLMMIMGANPSAFALVAGRPIFQRLLNSENNIDKTLEIVRKLKAIQNMIEGQEHGTTE
ncbi:hypothetical protein [Fischerella sp. PCC 9605]|uniref:hypothetical protein n=1 Tax=Fischerella sp. PCC 9605 TaxID=1173024 RepID=UPI00047A0F14|nr:hypothetical protein [Fischerella sp. PCC 9605]